MSVRFNKKGIDKVRRQIETEFNRQIQIGVDELRKDSEKFLEILLKRREETGEDALEVLKEYGYVFNLDLSLNTLYQER